MYCSISMYQITHSIHYLHVIIQQYHIILVSSGQSILAEEAFTYKDLDFVIQNKVWLYHMTTISTCMPQLYK